MLSSTFVVMCDMFCAANLEENEKIKSDLMPTKINEPKTPYHAPLGEDDDLDEGAIHAMIHPAVQTLSITDSQHRCHAMKQWTPSRTSVGLCRCC